LDEDGREGKSDDNKPIEVDIPKPSFNWSVGDLPNTKEEAMSIAYQSIV